MPFGHDTAYQAQQICDGWTERVVSKTRFIAETDTSGNILWVWRWGAQDRIARPIAEPSRHLPELDAAEFHGAPGGTIRDWLCRQASLLP